MICSRCGTYFQGDVRHCSKCGGIVVPENSVVNGVNSSMKQLVSVKGWLGRSLIAFIPLIGWIIYVVMLFVWAGDKTKEESFNTWAKAQILVMIICVCLAICAGVALIGALLAELRIC